MSSTTNYMENLFSVNKVLLDTGGLIFKNKSSTRLKKNLILCYSCFCIIYCQIIYTPAECFMFTHTHKNKDKFIEHVGMVLTHTLGTMKVLLWYYKNDVITGILNTLQSDEFLYESYKKFNPSEIARRIKRISDTINLVFFVLASLVPTFKLMPSVVELYNTENSEFINGSAICKDLLPYYSWIPFPSSTKISCAFAMVFQYIPMTIYAFQIVGEYCLACIVFKLHRRHAASFVRLQYLSAFKYNNINNKH